MTRLEARRQNQNGRDLVGAIQFLSPCAYCLGQCLERRLSIFPANAGICDTDTVLEASLALRRNLLVTWR